MCQFHGVILQFHTCRVRRPSAPPPRGGGAAAWRRCRAQPRGAAPTPERPASGISSDECRQGLSRPSAVTRMRSQPLQKRWLIGRSGRPYRAHLAGGRRGRRPASQPPAAADSVRAPRPTAEKCARSQPTQGAHRHQFDEAHLPRVRQRQGGEVGDLVVAHAAEEYAVERGSGSPHSPRPPARAAHPRASRHA